MKNTCKRYVDEFHMIKAGDCVIAGVSGGADSLCLFHVLNNLKGEMDFTLKVVHVEHGIRGEESKKDASFVEDLCRDYGIFCRVYEVDVPAYGKKHHLGEEEAARILRYDAFSREVDMVLKQGFSAEQIKVALAHHADDNAETILFQMARGSGITGMRGMKEVRRSQEGFFYIRPLLWASRKQIETFLQDMGQLFCVDSTNMNTEYSRNRIRKKILPELEKVNTEAVRHMNQTAKHLGQIQDYMTVQAKAAYKECVMEKNGTCEIEVFQIRTMHPALGEEIVKLAVYEVAGQKKDIGAVHLESVWALANMQSGRQIHLPYGITARREFHKIIIEKPNLESEANGKEEDGDNTKKAYEITAKFLEELKNSGREAKIPVEGGEFSLKIMKFSGEIEKIPKKKYTKFLDYDMIKIGFTIRTRQPSDRICMDQAGHHKKLKSYFVQEKVPKELRSRLWMIARESEILWVTGMRIAENCKITEKTKYGLQIQYNGGTEDGLHQATRD